MPRAADQDGAAVRNAERKNREQDYPDVEESPNAALLCLGVETFGRWSDHCVMLVLQLARAKARSANALLARSLEQGYSRRWWSLLSTAVQSCVAEGILRPAGADLLEASEQAALPPPVDVLDFNR